MDIQKLKQYIGKKIFFTLKNSFRYKIILKPEYIKGDTLSFPDKFNNPVSFDINEINFIMLSTD